MAIVMPTKTGSAEAASMNTSQQTKPMTSKGSGGPRMIMAVGSVR
ncbi:ribosomal protein L4 [Bradyrhizobium sp. USDA 4451]